MMKHSIRSFLFVITLAALATVAQAQTARVSVQNQAIHPVSPLLFGSFLEDTMAEEEGGIEAAVDPATRQLDPSVLNLIKELKPTLLRYPGGARVTYTDWTNFIDNAPNDGWAAPGRKTKLGIDRFLQLTRDVGSEPMLVVNFRKALLKERPLQDAALRAAGLVAYLNAPLGTKLPPGMPDWPRLRAQNGHPKPYKVKYFQIGNEMWIYNADLRKKLGEAAYRQWHVRCISEYVKAMKSVDPSIQLVTDAMGPETVQLFRQQFGDQLDFIAMHQYRPWAIDNVRSSNGTIHASALTPENVWNTYVAMPQISNGLSTIDLAEAREPHGYNVAVTEWNFNGWPCEEKTGKFPLHSSWAKGLGAAGYIHALLRADVKLATQSMLVGTTWGITSIRVDPSGKNAPYILPSGAVLAFYSKWHGSTRVASSTESAPHYRQDFQMGLLHPVDKVSTLDVVATADDKAVFVHLLHRGFSQPLSVNLSLDGFANLTREALLRTLSGHLHDDDGNNPNLAPLTREAVSALPLSENSVQLQLPPRTVSVLIIPRKNPRSPTELLGNIPTPVSP